jgi:hypothetical protein
MFASESLVKSWRTFFMEVLALIKIPAKNGDHKDRPYGATR